MILDAETGLPALPEGWRWLVENPIKLSVTLSYYGRGERDRDKLVVRLQRRELVLRDDLLEVLVTRSFRREEWSTEFSQPCRGIHPIAVQNAARAIYKRWQERQRVDALCGTFPPKKLGVAS